MSHQYRPHRPSSLLIIILAIVMLLLGGFSSFLGGQATFANNNPDGDLRIEVLTAYNLVVDSNVNAPSTYGPTAFTVGAKFCNDGNDPLTNVTAYIGDHDAGTPGIYPSRGPADSGFTDEHPFLQNPGTYQFQHEGGSAGTADATRFISEIPAGECVAQYWLLSYPQCENNPDGTFREPHCNAHDGLPAVSPVWGKSNDFTDDLWLNYDVWATADGGLEAHERRKATMRNEISAMANKIWPNGDNKVPDVYKQAIQEELGWDTWTPDGTHVSYPGQRVITTQGIWYDMGNVNQGFDNNGDLTPDYNAWMQPIGDPASFDSGCFRLVGSYGLLIVKRQGGQETLIPFKDQLYFENLPPDNTGVVGLVFYQYIALDGACTAGLSPYQEVASGRNNEKFNADFGTGIPSLTSQAIEATGAITKTAVPTQGLILPGTIDYAIEFNNPTTVSLGAPELGLPIVIQDSIPEGTIFVAGSAASGNTPPAGTSFTIRYSTDDGVSWTSTEPSASQVTDIQWWLSDDLEPGEGGTVTFQVQAQAGGVIFHNTAGIGLGNANPFAEDDAVTFAGGTNIIGGTVFADDGNNNADPNNFGNQQLDNNESGIADTQVSLYILVNGDYVLWETITNEADGTYEFTGLPNAEYRIIVGDIPENTYPGWTNTTDTTVDIDLTSGGNSEDNDFGYAPALTLQKNLLAPDPALEDQLVSYTIDVNNQLPGSGTAVGDNCVYTFWSTDARTITSGGNAWINPTFASGETPDGPQPELNGAYATSGFDGGSSRIGSNNHNITPQQGTIISVEALFYGYVSGPVDVPRNERATAQFFYDNNEQVSLEFGAIYLNDNLIGIENAQALVLDISENHPDGIAPSNWVWANFSDSQFDLRLEVNKSSGPGSSEIFHLDSIGFRVTTDQTCGGDSPSSTINPLPLTDTFNADQLEFVSADPAQTSVYTTAGGVYANTGTITWNNLGPLYAGGTETVTVTFRVKDGTFGETLTNTATVNNAFFSNGKPTNDTEDDAVTTIERTARIGDFIWFNTDDPANGIPGVQVSLTPDTDVVVDGITYGPTAPLTTITDSNGNYLFIGLPDATYTVEVDESTIPGATVTNISDPDGTNDSTLLVEVNGGTVTNTGNIWCLAANCELDADFGYDVPNTIMGAVWHDFNADALKQLADGELPLAGWTVELDTGSCTLGSDCPSTTTDANGLYVFSDLANGTYSVVVTPPADYIQTAESEDGDSANIVSCTVHPCNDTVANINVADGNIYAGYDFGYQQFGPHNISGTVYADWNGDASQQPDAEPGFAGITVTLYSETGAPITYTVTGPDGSYTFANLPDGNYIVVVDQDALPPGYSQTEDYDENGVCTTCDSQATTVEIDIGSINDVNFGYQPVGSGQIGNTVWVDLNGNGEQDGIRETGIPTVTVWLEIDLNGDGNWTRIMTATTDTNGNYLFAGLPDGDYRVIVDTDANEIPEGAGGFTYVPSTPVTQTVTIENGSVTELNGDPCTACDMDADFGFKPLAAIGDTVYWDANGNGEQDWNEEGIPGATIQLINANNFPVVYNGVTYAADAVMATTTTADGTGDDQAGFYQFTGLPTGDSSTPYLYTVEVTAVPGDPEQTADPDRDGEACDKTDIYPNSGDFACDDKTTVRVFPGTNFMGADFGYQPLGVIGDRVWFDFNGDGNQDPNEVGISGVVVTVTKGVETYTTTTDFDGYYSFANLEDGTWTVTFETPAGMTSVGAINQSVGTSTDVVINNGVVTSIGGVACTNCDLNVDSAFRYDGTSTLNGTICLDGNAPVGTGECNDPGIGNGVAPTQTALSGVPVYVYRWVDGQPFNTVELIGVTTTDSDGDYSFADLPNLIDDERYIVSTGAPFSDLYLTTDDPDYNIDVTSVVSVTVPSANVPGERDVVGAYQIITPNNGNDPGEPNEITNVDFAYLSHLIMNLGDLPADYNATLWGENGARHIVPFDEPNRIFLGNCIEAPMPDGQPDPEADAIACHDGINFFDGNESSWTDGGSEVVFTATVTGGAGYLYAWIDWDRDGTFAGANEFVDFGQLGVGSHSLTFNLPVNQGGLDPLNIRFRLFPEPLEDLVLLPQFGYVGSAYNGEVEDYQLSFSPTAVHLTTFMTNTPTGVYGWLLVILLIMMLGSGLLLVRLRRVRA